VHPEQARPDVGAGHVRQTLEEQAGQENTGVRLALYLKRMAGDINTPYDIIADNSLAEIARTTFSIPAEMANTDVDTKIIEKNLDIKDLQDPEKVEKLVTDSWRCSTSKTLHRIRCLCCSEVAGDLFGDPPSAKDWWPWFSGPVKRKTAVLPL
jgi:hypothetical protein